jgi:hypothetical protein
MTLSEQIKFGVGEIRKGYSYVDLANKAMMIKNLLICYQTVIATEDLLEDAINAPYAHGKLRDYFEKHLEEEKNHAVWLSQDLASEGIDAKSMPIDPYVKNMVGSQFYLIKYRNPCDLLGYMAVLEGFPPPMQEIEKLEELHGKKLFRTLRLHAEADPKHSTELWEIIDYVNDPLILDNAIATAYFGRELSHVIGN